jgi:hypothetical protein
MTPNDRRRALPLAIAATFALLLLPTLAATAGVDEAGARVLFAEARKLAAGGDYEAACPKFEDSYRLDPGIGTNFNLADCYEHIGRIATAWARFLDVAAATKAANQPERERVARARAAALEPRLSRLTINVESPADGFALLRDGVPIGAPSWGVAVPIDPGPHKLEASAPRKRIWSTTINIPDAATPVSVAVPPLDDAPEQPIPATPAAGTNLVTGLAPVGDVAMTQAGPRQGRWVPVAILGAVGAIALGTGVVFGIKYEEANGDARQICRSSVNCTMQEIDDHSSLVDTASRDLTIEAVSLGIGVAAVLAGGYRWWRNTRRSPRADSTHVFVEPMAFGLAGIDLKAAW